MPHEPPPSELVQRAMSGNSEAAGELFCRYERLLRTILRMRINRRLLQRVDMDDVLQEIYVEYSRSLSDYTRYAEVPFHLWLRMLALRKLQTIHRHHLGTRARAADREVSLYAGPLPEVSSYSLAIQLIGGHTSPTQAAARAELQLSIQAALDEMEPIDREILALRHFEELSNSDAAQVLGISPGAASNRYVRSLRRIKHLLQTTNPQILNPSAEKRDGDDSQFRTQQNSSR